MTDTIKPIAYCCINRQGDITSTIKHKDSWRKAPLYDESAIEQARQEGRDESAAEVADLRRQLAATRKQLVYEFNGDDVPSFRDGVLIPHELEDVVDAERCRSLANIITGLRKQLEATINGEES